MADNVRLTVAVIIMVVAITVFYVYAAQYSTLLRVIGLLASVGISLFIASTTTVGSVIFDYVRDTRTEVRKVVWPTSQETIQTTMIVLLMVMIVALLLWGFDSLLGWAVRALTS